MIEDTKIQAGDLVIVIDDSECSEIKNGGIHQVNRVYKNSITLVGKVGIHYYTKRFKKVYSSQTSSPEKDFEDVLKIEIAKIDDDYSYFKIVYQNTDVLKRGDFVDADLCVESYACPHFPGSRNSFFLRGTDEQLDNKPTIIKTEHIEELMRRVNSINEKYGIRKRWRAKKWM